ncbi:MAG: amidase [Spirochaetales bacterium]|nr:amidase [Spirochaetales bacterium]
MEYKKKTVLAPKLQGFRLLAASWALERTFPGRLISKSIFAALGVDDFRTRNFDGGPKFTPERIFGTGSDRPEWVPIVPGLAPLPTLEIQETIGTTQRPEKSNPFPSVLDYAQAYAAGSLNPVEVAERVIHVLEKQNKGNPPLYGFISWKSANILAQAQESAKRIAEGRARSVFEGVPVAVKDEIDVAGYATTLGTSFKNLRPATSDAFVVSRLKEAGALILGKTNMHEIGIGVTGLNPFYGTPANPYAPWRYPGGSSSGSASVVASGICPVALGADGGGSVRIPSAYCGIFGLKPTWGRTSSTGEAPLGATVSNIGPMGGNVRDLALAYLVIAGADPADPATHKGPAPNLDGFLQGVQGLKIGIYRPWFEDGREEVVQTARALVDNLVALGAQVIDIELPDIDLLRIAHLVTISSEMRSAMDPDIKVRASDFGHETRSSLALARHLTISDYLQAQKVRALLTTQIDKAFESVDLIATPTTANLPPRLHKDRLLSGVSDLESLSQTMRFAMLANMVGNPAISIPAGFVTAKSKIFWQFREEKDEDGKVFSQVPVGLQLIGKPWDEALLLRVARVCEEIVVRPRPRVYLSAYEHKNPLVPGYDLPRND